MNQAQRNILRRILEREVVICPDADPEACRALMRRGLIKPKTDLSWADWRRGKSTSWVFTAEGERVAGMLVGDWSLYGMKRAAA